MKTCISLLDVNGNFSKKNNKSKFRLEFLISFWNWLIPKEKFVLVIKLKFKELYLNEDRKKLNIFWWFRLETIENNFWLFYFF